jgi:outer membrane protein
MKTRIKLTAMLLLACYQIEAQTPVWDMDQCMQYAVENSNDVKIQQWRNRSTREDVKAARGSFFPSLNGSVGASRSFGRSIDPETNTYSNTSNFSNPYELSGSFPLFQAGALINKLRASKVGALMGEQDQMLKNTDVAIKTMQAYADYLYYAEAVQLAHEKLEQSTATHAKTERMVELGLKSAADLALIYSDVAADEYNQVRQQNLREQALLTLKGAMNYPLDSLLNVDTHAVEELTLTAFITDEAQLFESAKAWLPQAKRSELNLRNSALQVSIARARLYPSLSLNGGINSRYFENMTAKGKVTPFASQLKNNLGEWVGISLNIPIFNGWSRRSSLQKSKNNLHIAQLEKDETMRQLQTEIELVVNDCNGLHKESQQMARKVEADQLAYTVTLRKYEKGLLSVFDLQISNHTLFQSKIEQLRIQLNYILKQRLAAYYNGQPIIRKK